MRKVLSLLFLYLLSLSHVQAKIGNPYPSILVEEGKMWTYYKKIHHLNKTDKEEITVLPNEEELYFIDLVKKLDETHNRKEFDEVGENNPYAEIVYFYGMKMSGLDAHLKKVELLATIPDFRQESSNIKVTKISQKLVVCDFSKCTYARGKTKIYPNCYLFFIDTSGEGFWKIAEESDMETDNNLKKRRKSDNKTDQPLSLQFIREYCDYLQLPYYYWGYVRNEIIEQSLNNLPTAEPDWETQPSVLRGHIAMNYKYKNEVDFPVDFVHYYNYNEFCAAIGVIKDVWNIVPVRIENDDEDKSPLFQFYYESDNVKKVLITAIQIVDEMDEVFDEPIEWHYKYVRDDDNEEVTFNMVTF